MRFLTSLLPVALALAQQEPTPGRLLGQPLGALAALRWVTADGKPPPPAPTVWRWWTVGCPFCRDSLPDLAALAKAHAAQGLRLVAVFHDKSGRPPTDAQLQAYLAELGVDAVLARDDEWRELRPLLQRGASTQATSISIVTDAAGIVRHVHPGPRLHERQAAAHPAAAAAFTELRAAIAAMLGPVSEMALDAAIPARRVQVWQPPGPAQGPIVVWIAGSGWRQSGQEPEPIAAALQAAGIRCVVASHRLGAPGSWRLALQDAAYAVAAVRSGLNGRFAAGSPIVLAGHGSGAWAALLLASDPQWLAAVDVPRTDIVGILAMSPPTDLRAAEAGKGRRFGDLLLREGDAVVFGNDAGRLAVASPVGHAAHLPPTICVVGAGDLPMLLADANVFAARVREAGGRAEVVRAPGRRHAQVPLVLRVESGLRAELLEFLRDPSGLPR